MSERRIRLAEKRAALLAHSAVQRGELSQQVQEIETRLASVDRGINMVRRYAAQPLLMVGVAALLVMVGPRKILRWAGRSAVFLTAGRRVARLLPLVRR
ncbi:MAG: YqjK family protein [Povalibacter sp.]